MKIVILSLLVSTLTICDDVLPSNITFLILLF